MKRKTSVDSLKCHLDASYDMGFGKHNRVPLAAFTRFIENSSTNHGTILI